MPSLVVSASSSPALLDTFTSSPTSTSCRFLLLPAAPWPTTSILSERKDKVPVDTVDADETDEARTKLLPAFSVAAGGGRENSCTRRLIMAPVVAPLPPLPETTWQLWRGSRGTTDDGDDCGW